MNNTSLFSNQTKNLKKTKANLLLLNIDFCLHSAIFPIYTNTENSFVQKKQLKTLIVCSRNEKFLIKISWEDISCSSLIVLLLLQNIKLPGSKHLMILSVDLKLHIVLFDVGFIGKNVFSVLHLFTEFSIIRSPESPNLFW